MFFGQDVLFHNGPLAILWMAGNGRLSLKNTADARKREYRLILDANIPELCATLRKYFPQMGTAHGMSLKQAMTLVKGINFVYCYNMNYFAKQIFLDAMKISMNNIARLKAIDLEPQTVKPASTRNKRAVEDDPAGGMANGYGNLQDITFEMLDAEDLEPRRFANNESTLPPVSTLQGVHPYFHESPKEKTKRGHKKRKTDEDSQIGTEEVMEMLKNATRNANAHLLIESDLNLNQVPLFADTNFDDGGEFLASEITSDIPAPAAPIVVEDPNIHSPPGRAGTGFGDDAHPRAMGRRRLDFEDERQAFINDFGDTNTNQQQPDLDVLELESLEEEGQAERRIHRVRRRLGIDEVHQIPMTYMMEQIGAQKRPLDYDELREVSLHRVFEAKELKGMTKIDQVGRRIIGSCLSNLTTEQKRACQTNAHKEDELTDQDISTSQPGRVEAERHRENMTTFAPQQSTVGPRGLAPNTGMASPSSRGDLFQQPGLSEIDEQAPIEEVMPGVDFNTNAFDPMDENLPPVDNERTDEQARINSLEIGTSAIFKQLFPPGVVSRRKAAKGFLCLLKWQSMQKVSLEQKDPYGDIVITRT